MTKTIDLRKYHPKLTQQVMDQAREIVGPDMSDEELAEFMSANLQMVEEWGEQIQ